MLYNAVQFRHQEQMESLANQDRYCRKTVTVLIISQQRGETVQRCDMQMRNPSLTPSPPA